MISQHTFVINAQFQNVIGASFHNQWDIQTEARVFLLLVLHHIHEILTHQIAVRLLY